MLIEFHCANCDQEYSVPPKHASRTISCRTCGKSINIPPDPYYAPTATSPNSPTSDVDPSRAVDSREPSAETDSRISRKSEISAEGIQEAHLWPTGAAPHEQAPVQSNSAEVSREDSTSVDVNDLPTVIALPASEQPTDDASKIPGSETASTPARLERGGRLVHADIKGDQEGKISSDTKTRDPNKELHLDGDIEDDRRGKMLELCRSPVVIGVVVFAGVLIAAAILLLPEPNPSDENAQQAQAKAPPQTSPSEASSPEASPANNKDSDKRPASELPVREGNEPTEVKPSRATTDIDNGEPEPATPADVGSTADPEKSNSTDVPNSDSSGELNSDTRPADEPAPKPTQGPTPEPPQVPDPQLNAKPPTTAPAGSTDEPIKPPSKQSAPTGAILEIAESKVKSLFEFAKFKTPQEKIQLVNTLLARGAETKDNAAARYVMLREARDLATSVNHFPLAFSAVEELDSSYKIDALQMKLTVLNSIRLPVQLVREYKVLLEEAELLRDAAVANDQYDVALGFSELVIKTARMFRAIELAKDARTREDKIRLLQEEFASILDELVLLKTTPDDPQANMVVGKFYCFTKESWDVGLPYLAKCPNADVSEIAKRDLEHPVEADVQVELADDWWKLVQQIESVHKKSLQRRAEHWYQEAIPQLKGLKRLRVEKRLKEIFAKK